MFSFTLLTSSHALSTYSREMFNLSCKNYWIFYGSLTKQKLLLCRRIFLYIFFYKENLLPFRLCTPSTLDIHLFSLNNFSLNRKRLKKSGWIGLTQQEIAFTTSCTIFLHPSSSSSRSSASFYQRWVKKSLCAAFLNMKFTRKRMNEIKKKHRRHENSLKVTICFRTNLDNAPILPTDCKTIFSIFGFETQDVEPCQGERQTTEKKSRSRRGAFICTAKELEQVVTLCDVRSLVGSTIWNIRYLKIENCTPKLSWRCCAAVCMPTLHL